MINIFLQENSLHVLPLQLQQKHHPMINGNGKLLEKNGKMADKSSNYPFVSHQINKKSQNREYQDEPIYSNSLVIANKHQTDGMVSDGTLKSALSSSKPSLSPYVMYSLDSTINLKESSMDPNPMSNFDERRKSVLSGSTQSIYSQLQFPSASNFGSMKRKKKQQAKASKTDEMSTTESDVSSSDTNVVVNNVTEHEYLDNNVKIWSLQYVPQVMSVSKKTVKV